MIDITAQLSRVLVFVINATSIALVVTVLLGTKRPILKRIFILMTLLMFIWVDLAFAARIISNDQIGLMLIRIAWSIAPLVFILIFSFIINFEKVEQQYRKITYGLYVFGAFLFLLVLATPFVIANISTQNGVVSIVYGDLVWLFFGSVAVLTILNFFFLFKSYFSKNTPQEVKNRLRFIIAGLTFFFVMNAAFNITAPVFFRRFDLYWYGDYSLFVFLVLIAYVIVQHEIFGAKVVLSSFLTTFLGSFLFVDAFILSDGLVERLTKLAVGVLYIPFGYLLIRSVITEIEQRRELEELNTQLKQLDKQKDEFISVAAHELRAPMTAIKGYISMILDGDAGDIPEEASEYLSETSAVTDRLIRLVNNMLNVSRIEEGRLVYQMDKVKLSDIAKEVYSEFKITASSKSLEFTLDIQPEINDTVYVDSDRLHEVITNFVSNATKFTEAGFVKMKVSQSIPSVVRMEVIDSGPGVSKEEQKKLFGKFVRAESTAGKTIGSGLGLYISKLLIEKFGGKIGLVSESGKGSNFWFDLPVAD